MSEQNRKWFDTIKSGLSDRELAAAIKASWENVLATADRTGQNIVLPQSDLEKLYDYTQSKNESVKNAALNVLIEEIRSRCEDGPVSWDDLDAWLMNEEEDIRHEAMFAIGAIDSAAYEVCVKDRAKCVSIIGEALEEYMDYTADGTFWSLAREDDKWLDACWAEAGRLVDLENSEITDMLSSGFIRDVLYSKKLGVNDPRVKSWIEGDSQPRKLALLGVTQWMGIDDGKLREIVQALADGNDPEVAAQAKELLGA